MISPKCQAIIYRIRRRRMRIARLWPAGRTRQSLELDEQIRPAVRDAIRECRGVLSAVAERIGYSQQHIRAVVARMGLDDEVYRARMKEANHG
jgi:hypothetical protein